jgi:GNAT superfamily N-acetyltransferase
VQDHNIQPFDAATASKEEWTNFHKYRRRRSNEVFPGDPVEDDAVYEEWARTVLDENEVKSYAVALKEVPSEIIAWLRMHIIKETSPSYAGNEHYVVVDLAVLKEHRRKGIGLSLLKLVYEFANEKKKRTII